MNKQIVRILQIGLSALLCFSTGGAWAHTDYDLLAPISTFDPELQRERKISGLLKNKILGGTDEDGLPDRSLFLEDLIRALISGKRTMAVYLKIQNFKEFNTLGEKQYFGYYLGDFIISETGKELKVRLERLLNRLIGAGGEIEASIYNEGPGFLILFQARSAGTYDFPIEDVIRFWLIYDETFRQAIISNVKERLDEVEELKNPRPPRDPQTGQVPEVPPWEVRIGAINREDLNFYAGMSNIVSISGPYTSTRIFSEANMLDRHAQRAARVAQLLNDASFLSIYEDPERRGSKEVWQEYLKPGPGSFYESLSNSQVARGTRVLTWGEEVDESASLLRNEFGIGGIFDEYYSDTELRGLVANQDEFYRKLLEVYAGFIESGILGSARRIRDTIFRKKFLYRGRYFEPERDGTVFDGRKELSTMINYLIQTSPDAPWDRVFVVGGDEVVRCIWDGEKETLIPGDISYMGLYNRQWGHELGDWVKDNILRIFAQTPDPASVPAEILRFFEDMSGRPLILPDEHPIIVKLRRSFPIQEYGEVREVEGRREFILRRLPPVQIQTEGQPIWALPTLGLGSISINVAKLDRGGISRYLEFDKLLRRAEAISSRRKAEIKTYQLEHRGALNLDEVTAFEQGPQLPFPRVESLNPGIRTAGMSSITFNPLGHALAEWMLRVDPSAQTINERFAAEGLVGANL